MKRKQEHNLVADWSPYLVATCFPLLILVGVMFYHDSIQLSNTALIIVGCTVVTGAFIYLIVFAMQMKVDPQIASKVIIVFTVSF
jgi:hypothetical protein